MNNHEIVIIPVPGMPVVTLGSDIVQQIIDALERRSIDLTSGDIVVVTHSIVSVTEGAVHLSNSIEPSERASRIAAANNEDPIRVEVALREAREVIRETPILLTRTHHGITTDYSGVDKSNAPDGHIVALPKDPDDSARSIAEGLTSRFGFEIPVIISDTQGRPWRRGAANMAIGVSGLRPIVDNSGRRDIHGNALRSSAVCLADEIAAAAELVMGQAAEGVPVVIVRGVLFERDSGRASDIVRGEEEDLFG